MADAELAKLKIRRIEASSAIQAGARAHDRWREAFFAPALHAESELFRQIGNADSIDSTLRTRWQEPYWALGKLLPDEHMKQAPSIYRALPVGVESRQADLRQDSHEIMDLQLERANSLQQLSWRNTRFVAELKEKISKCSVISSYAREKWLASFDSELPMAIFLNSWTSLIKTREMVEKDIAIALDTLSALSQRVGEVARFWEETYREEQRITLTSDIAFRRARDRIII